jgi:hypothetical protein
MSILFVTCAAMASLSAQVSLPVTGAPVGIGGGKGSSGAKGNTGPAAATVAPASVPGEARDYLKTLGKRLTNANLALSVRTGTYTDEAGASTITFTWQNPGKVRAVVVGKAAQTITWNGSAKQGKSSLSAANNDLLDTLADDCSEAFFFSVAHGAGLRLLAPHARTDGGKNPNYTGPWYTVYQRFAVAPSTGTLTGKVFMFDESTGLLSKVRYLQGRTPVEIQYSNWQLRNGEYTPGTIVRLSGGKTEFTLNFGAPSFSIAGPVAIFSSPQ